MSTLFYLIFGFFDVLAVLMVVFKMYRWPFRQYIKEAIAIGVTLSIGSFIIRIILESPEIDMLMQFILYILFFRFYIRIKLYYAFPLSAIGYLFYTVVQFVIIPILIWMGVVSLDDLTKTNGFGTYLIQFVTEASCFIFSYLLYKFGAGFSHISRPPHDVGISVEDKNYKIHVLANILATLTVSFTLYWMFNYYNSVIIILPTCFVALAVLIYLSYRKDFGSL